jgi:transposase-like protein
MKLWLLKLANKILDMLINLVNSYDACKHSRPMCDKCRSEWNKSRLSAGGW